MMMQLEAVKAHDSSCFQNIYYPKRQMLSGTRRRFDFMTNGWKKGASNP